MPLQFSGTVIALKCSVPPRVIVIVAVSVAAVAALAGWVAVDLSAATVTTFSCARSLVSAVWSSSVAPSVCAVVGSNPVHPRPSRSRRRRRCPDPARRPGRTPGVP